MNTQNDQNGAVRFDVRQFARTARGNHRESLQLAEFADAPLDSDTLHALRYLGRLEGATMEQLRNLLVTATHKDARVTAFLVTWAFEKYWIADALDAVLEAHGAPRIHSVEEGEPRHTFAESAERRGPIRRAILAIGQGVPVIAVHTTMGLVDEWVMRTAYQRVLDTTSSPSLTEAIDIIIETKKRHAEFFEDEARRRIQESSRALAQTRKALSHIVWPLGAVDRAASDRTFFESFVFGGDDGRSRADAIGDLVATLPGIDAGIGAGLAQRLRP